MNNNNAAADDHSSSSFPRFSTLNGKQKRHTCNKRTRINASPYVYNEK